MNFINCFHPVEVTVRGEKKIVPCGKCDYCKSIRSKSLADRFYLESCKHKYMVFVTLTYSNYFLPKFHYLPRFKSVVADCDMSTAPANLDDGFCLDCSKYPDDSVSTFLDDMDKNLGYIPYLRKTDFQKWIKRLRINIDRHLFKILLKYGKVTEQQKSEFNLLYLGCGEYGPKRFRPHYHACLLFDREEILTSFDHLLRESWPYGRLDFRYCSDRKKEAEYVSRYVSCVTRLPKFYQRREIRPFQVFSKSVPLGLSYIGENQVQDIIARGTPFIRYQLPASAKVIELSVWPSLENRIFPKFAGSGGLDDSQRNRLLKFAASYESFKNFEDEIYNYRFFQDIEKDRPFHSLYKPYFPSWFTDYFLMYYSGVKSSDYHYLNKRRVSCGLYSLFLAGKKIRLNSQKYGYTIDGFLSKYSDYYHNKELYKLQKQFEFEDSFYDDYPELLEYIDIGLTDVEDLMFIPQVKHVKDYIDDMIYKSHKSRFTFEYLSDHPERNMYTSKYDDFGGLAAY